MLFKRIALTFFFDIFNQPDINLIYYFTLQVLIIMINIYLDIFSYISLNISRLSSRWNQSTFVPGASRMWRNLASWMYGRGVLCKRSRKSFHPRSIESLPKVDPLSHRRRAFRKLAYTVTETLHTWNVAFDTTKVESISLSDSKCLEIKDSTSSTCLPNLNDTITWIDSITQFLIKWTVLIKVAVNHFYLLYFLKSY